ncbi:uncharacterized protein BKA78DRAFT_18843 [Phyllosticta capitalensis]|uniref:uncharacterized protein n=1 Tax=Phyllosticta capitalensis TaxID=121624 RepID=UPI00312CF9B0
MDRPPPPYTRLACFHLQVFPYREKLRVSPSDLIRPRCRGSSRTPNATDFGSSLMGRLPCTCPGDSCMLKHGRRRRLFPAPTIRRTFEERSRWTAAGPPGLINGAEIQRLRRAWTTNLTAKFSIRRDFFSKISQHGATPSGSWSHRRIWARDKSRIC